MLNSPYFKTLIDSWIIHEDQYGHIIHILPGAGGGGGGG